MAEASLSLPLLSQRGPFGSYIPLPEELWAKGCMMFLTLYCTLPKRLLLHEGAKAGRCKSHASEPKPVQRSPAAAPSDL